MMNKVLIWVYISLLKQWYGYKRISTEVIYAQAKHETGDFTSKIFKENKNLFGMRKPSIRANSVNGENNGHATFSSLYNSVRDYFQRQNYFEISNQNNDLFMASTVNSNYAEDKAYLQKWSNVRRNLRLPIYIKYSHWVVYLLVIYIAFRVIEYLYEEFKPDERQRFKRVPKVRNLKKPKAINLNF